MYFRRCCTHHQKAVQQVHYTEWILDAVRATTRALTDRYRYRYRCILCNTAEYELVRGKKVLQMRWWKGGIKWIHTRKRHNAFRDECVWVWGPVCGWIVQRWTINVTNDNFICWLCAQDCISWGYDKLRRCGHWDIQEIPRMADTEPVWACFGDHWVTVSRL